MSKGATVLLALAVGLAAGVPLGSRLMPTRRRSGRCSAAATTAAAVTTAIGAEDILGSYDAR